MKQIQCDVPTVFLALFLSRRVHLTLLPSVKGSNLSLFYYQSRFARTSEKKKKRQKNTNCECASTNSTFLFYPSEHVVSL